MPAVIELEGLTKIYKAFGGPVTAVNGLSLAVEQGEIFGLVGPNGSGKTTTLKLLLGLLYPTKGQARVFGKDPVTDTAVRQRLGFLPEGPYFYEHLDAVEVLSFYAQLFRIPKNEKRQRIDRLLEQVGMADRQHVRLGQCSRGMVQRIGLAQALINDPDLVLLDEPTSGLDPLGARDMRNHILSLREQGKTVFLCSHLLSEVERMCDRVAILHQGHLLEVLRMSEVTGSLEDHFVELVEEAQRH